MYKDTTLTSLYESHRISRTFPLKRVIENSVNGNTNAEAVPVELSARLFSESQFLLAQFCSLLQSWNFGSRYSTTGTVLVVCLRNRECYLYVVYCSPDGPPRVESAIDARRRIGASARRV